VSEAASQRTVGILPALGSGLTDLRRTGQHERLLAYDLRHYGEAYDRVYYFSYFRESLADFTRDPLLLERVTVLPKRGPWPNRLYALVLPLVYRRQMRQCEALRVEQFPGVIPALVARWRWRIPFVVTYGYHYAEVARIAGSRIKPRLFRWLERLAFPRAAGVIVTSSEMEALLRSHPSHPRLACFPNGVDTERFSPPAGARPPRTRGTVIYAGRLEQEKNLARLIDAMSAIRDPAARLVLLGDGSLRGALERRARAAGLDAEFKGVVPHSELPRHFHEADCFALPSLTEGHPKALIEAMACGLPCAASARGGIPTLLEDGVTGLLFDPEDTADIARTIGRLLGDAALARRLGDQARAVARARYDAHALLKAEVAFVQSVSGVTGLFEAYADAVPMDDVPSEFVADRLRRLAERGPRTVLDLGAGDGRYLELFASLLPPGATVVGCEISLRRARRIHAKGFRVVVAQSEALPFRDAAFDLVSFLEVIEHTQAPGRSLDEVRRALRPGGQLAMTTPNYPMKRLFDLRAALRQKSLARLRDDPTHISPLSAARLERLLFPRFERVDLEGTAIPGEGHLRWLGTLRRSRLGRRLSNKLFALCTKDA
jgi:glycosyltransferase involved in cell wall biosynthesis/2-polyprenyl-3-methyl-5-hydroxy-6-metoxy-1,4-benzoquinol methylase